jgi:mRNA-decapping enzyme subunit 2
MQAFEEFLLYKTRVPVRGAIMLNHAMDSVVLVKGWKKGANWSFPRGKINKDEDDLDCAIREVYEETGYDIREAGLVPHGDGVKYIERTMRDQHMRLYVFRDVPMDTHFEPRTRKEISKIQWYRLSELPAFRKKGQNQQENTETAADANKFYMVAPFLVPLKKWVVEQKKKDTHLAYNSQNRMPTYQEDIQTEGEQSYDRSQGMESANDTDGPLSLGLDTMAGATAALQALLKIQPPTQGLQPDAASTAASPATRNTGEALLAFLQSKPSGGTQNHSHQSPAVPHTPLDHTIQNATVPNTPYHQHPRPPQFSSMQPPPSFPVQPSHGSYPYQGHQKQPQQQPMQHSMAPPNYAQHGPILQHSYTPPQQELLQRFQPQQIRHPQPLPPQVQRAVFTEDQMHGTMTQQRVIQAPPPLPPSQQQQSNSYHLPQPQFPGVHAPIIPPNQKQDPARLTSHSLALLNTFKNRDQGPSTVENDSHLLLHQFTQPPGHSTNPQELSAENISEMSGADEVPIPQKVPARHAPTDSHRSSLLNMFKSPTLNAASVVSQPSSMAHPGNVPRQTAYTMAPSQARPAEQEVHSRTESLSQDSQHQSPFRPTSILARPAQEPAQIDVPFVGPRGHGKGPLSPLSQSQAPGRSALSPVIKPASIHVKDKVSKPFQPQILRRPQQSVITPLAELAAPSPTSNPGPFMSSSPDQHGSQPAEHKQNLLSLFGKGPSPVSPAIAEKGLSIQTPEHPMALPVHPSTRSRVGSLAAAGAETMSQSSRKSSQAPISPADKGFLLGYLNAVVKDSNR